VEIVIAHRFRGPAASANGGYACGRLAAFVDGPAEVTLRLPPPLERPLRVEREGAGVLLLDGDALVAEARPAEVEVDPTEPPSFEEARAVELPSGDAASPFPECFVCGRDRDRDDGLRIFPGAWNGGVAATWTPPAELCAPEFVWSALDCPGAYAAGALGRGEPLLGRLTVRVESLPRAGEHCVVLGWPLGEDGRKLFPGTALFGEGGRLLGVARATWLLPRT
jgi:hypothetical protein